MGHKPRVALLHGVGLDHHMWDAVCPLLESRFDVYTPDLLGHGTSAAASSSVTLAELAGDVADPLAPDTHLIGFSLGALVGQHLAVHRPELAASLTSVNSVCRRTPKERASVLARLEMATKDFPASVEASIERWFPSNEPRNQQTIDSVRDTLLANEVSSYLNCYRIFATADEELAGELHRIDAPSLASTGELDPGSTPEMTHRLADSIPNCRAVVVPDARHMLPVQKPDTFVDAISKFIWEKSYVQ
jgi:pimeloyl-ACP methyl ester carboxylesterase